VPFRISGGVLRIRRSLIVMLEDGEGNTGFGESAPFELPFYSGETTASALACLRDVLLPRIVGVPLTHPSEVWTLLAEGVRGNRMARAGVETAWWDLQGRRRGVSLADLVTERLVELGVPPGQCERREHVQCGVALGIPEDESVATLRDEVRAAVAAGYQRVKIKVQPGWDVEPVLATQAELAELGAALPLSVDANGAYDVGSGREALGAMDRLGLLFVEQPFPEDSLWDSAEWHRTARTPVCLDETLVSDRVARQVVEMGGPLIWNLKVQRLGGLEETCRVYARGVDAGARMWVGTMPETGVGAQSALAIAGHRACVFPTDVEASDRWYRRDTDLIDLVMRPDGSMAVPTQHVNPPMDRLVLAAEIR
jgi:O-succinylbenzoate synthase